MLVEKDRELDIASLKRYHPVPPRNEREKELLFGRVVGRGFIDLEGEAFLVPKEADRFFERIDGKHTTLSDAQERMYDMLVDTCDVDPDSGGREMSFGGFRVTASSNDGTYFTIRRGNSWGSIFCWWEDLDPPALRDRVYDMLDAFRGSGWEINRLLPPAKMIDKILREKVVPSMMANISTGGIDIKVLERAWSCFRGGRMEAIELGAVDRVYDYDLNAAYFSVFRELPALNPMLWEWIDSKEYVEDAEFGFCRCYVDCGEDLEIGPVGVRLEVPSKIPRTFYPKGDSVAWRTKDEIDMLRMTDKADVEIIEGSWGRPKRYVPRALKSASSVIEKLLADPRTNEYAKYMASISWGKFASLMSTHWNPIYSSVITSRIRSKITEIALARPSDVIAITVDGIVLKHPLPDDVISRRIGELKVKVVEDLVSLADYYRYDFSESDGKRGWRIDEEGILVKIRHPVSGSKELLIPFGSAKRKAPGNITFHMLTNRNYRLNPPLPEEAVELFLTTKEFLLPKDMG